MSDSTIRKTESRTFFLPNDRLYLATRAWIIWLQGLFSTRPPGNFKWHKNSTESEILITDQYPTNIGKSDKRPIITTSRGSAQFLGTSRDTLLSRNMDGTSMKFTDLIGTTLTFNCIAKEGIEAQELAYSIFRMIPVFKPSIMRLGRMHAIGNNIAVSAESQHGAIVPGSSFPEWRLVQVSVPFYIQDVISAASDFHNVMKAVNLHMGIKDSIVAAKEDSTVTPETQNLEVETSEDPAIKIVDPSTNSLTVKI